MHSPDPYAKKIIGIVVQDSISLSHTCTQSYKAHAYKNSESSKQFTSQKALRKVGNMS